MLPVQNEESWLADLTDKQFGFVSQQVLICSRAGGKCISVAKYVCTRSNPTELARAVTGDRTPKWFYPSSLYTILHYKILRTILLTWPLIDYPEGGNMNPKCSDDRIWCGVNKLAKLQASLVRNYDSPTDSLTGVKCRATSVAKKAPKKAIVLLKQLTSFLKILGGWVGCAI